MSSVYELPFTNQPETFEIELAGTTYNINCRWNDADQGGWVFDLSDVNNNALACNIPLIVGADLLI